MFYKWVTMLTWTGKGVSKLLQNVQKKNVRAFRMCFVSCKWCHKPYISSIVCLTYIYKVLKGEAKQGDGQNVRILSVFFCPVLCYF